MSLSRIHVPVPVPLLSSKIPLGPDFAIQSRAPFEHGIFAGAEVGDDVQRGFAAFATATFGADFSRCHQVDLDHDP